MATGAYLGVGGVKKVKRMLRRCRGWGSNGKRNLCWCRWSTEISME